MKDKHKRYLRLNLISLLFIAVSFISITLAWFAYSGLASVKTEVSVKAWYIEFQQNKEAVSSDIVISLDEIYPGMETVSEKVDIKNLGDSNAQLNYSIVSARILDDEITNDNTNSEFLEDKLSHEYPFNININLSRKYALAKDGTSSFEVSISWPLDSDHDDLDSKWGNDSYQFQKNEEAKLKANANYQIRPSIKIVISLRAEQFIENNDSSDINFNLGDLILFDVANNKRCEELSTTCIRTHIIDVNNKIGDTSVTLLPDLFDSYATGSYNEYNELLSSITSSWNVNNRPLRADDLLKVISNDIMNSLLKRNNLSDQILGNLNYENRISKELNKATIYNGYYSFLNDKYPFLSTGKCYWLNTEYNENKAFALMRTNQDSSKIYGEDKVNNCNVVPVLEVSKMNLQ